MNSFTVKLRFIKQECEEGGQGFTLPKPKPFIAEDAKVRRGRRERQKKEAMSSRRPSGARAFFSARVGLRDLVALSHAAGAGVAPSNGETLSKPGGIGHG